MVNDINIEIMTGIKFDKEINLVEDSVGDFSPTKWYTQSLHDLLK